MNEVAAGIVTEIKHRTEGLMVVFDFMSCATSLFFLFIILRVLHYRYKFLTNERFDNKFITKDFRNIDLRRAQLGKETVLPLNHRERVLYISVGSARLVQSERIKLSKSAVVLGIATLKLCTHMMADYALFWVLTLIRYHARFQSTVKTPNIPTLHIEGTGILASLLRSIVKAFQPFGIKLEIDTIPCLPDPIPPDYDRYVQIASLLVLCWILAIFEPYGLRLRHSVMCYYHPIRAKQRSIWLYNHILRARSSFLKFARRQLRRKVMGSKDIEKVTCKEHFRAKISSPILRMCMCLGEDRQNACLLCGQIFRETDSVKPIRCQTPGCPGTYCADCFADLQNICTICLNPIDYGDLSDISEEKDSSEDEKRPKNRKKNKGIMYICKKPDRDSGDDDDDDANDSDETKIKLLKSYDQQDRTQDSDYTSDQTSEYSYSYQNEKDITEMPITPSKSSFVDVEKQHIPDYASMDSAREKEISTDDLQEEDSSTELDIEYTPRSKPSAISRILTRKKPCSNLRGLFGNKRSKTKQEDIPLLPLEDVEASEFTDETETTRTKSTRTNDSLLSSDISIRTFKSQRSDATSTSKPSIKSTPSKIPKLKKLPVRYTHRFKNIKYEVVKESPTSSSYSTTESTSPTTPKHPENEFSVNIIDEEKEPGGSTQKNKSKIPKPIGRPKKLTNVFRNMFKKKQKADSQSTPVIIKYKSNGFETSHMGGSPRKPAQHSDSIENSEEVATDRDSQTSPTRSELSDILSDANVVIPTRQEAVKSKRTEPKLTVTAQKEIESAQSKRLAAHRPESVEKELNPFYIEEVDTNKNTGITTPMNAKTQTKQFDSTPDQHQYKRQGSKEIEFEGRRYSREPPEHDQGETAIRFSTDTCFNEYYDHDESGSNESSSLSESYCDNILGMPCRKMRSEMRECCEPDDYNRSFVNSYDTCNGNSRNKHMGRVRSRSRTTNETINDRERFPSNSYTVANEVNAQSVSSPDMCACKYSSTDPEQKTQSTLTRICACSSPSKAIRFQPAAQVKHKEEPTGSHRMEHYRCSRYNRPYNAERRIANHPCRHYEDFNTYPVDKNYTNDIDDQASVYSNCSRNTDYMDLTYQNKEEYLDLVQELEDTLSQRNRDRVQKTMMEFERLSRQNKNLEKPIFDDEDKASHCEVAKVIQRNHHHRHKSKEKTCRCLKHNNQQNDMQMIPCREPCRETCREPCHEPYPEPCREPYREPFHEPCRETGREVCRETCHKQAPGYVNKVVKYVEPKRYQKFQHSTNKSRWELNPRTGEWYKVYENYNNYDIDYAQPPLPQQRVCSCDCYESYERNFRRNPQRHGRNFCCKCGLRHDGR